MQSGWRRNISTLRLLLTLVMLTGVVSGNVGGVFYQRSISGVVPADSTVFIREAHTTLSINQSGATFKTVYKVSADSLKFVGTFFGLRFDSIRVNDQIVLDPIVKAMGREPLWAQNGHLEYADTLMVYDRVSFSTSIRADSTFEVSGVLRPQRGELWGLATLPNMTGLRHLLLADMRLYSNEYSIMYVFEPIGRFRGLNKVTCNTIGYNISLLERKPHGAYPPLQYFPLRVNQDSITHDFNAPDTISLPYEGYERFSRSASNDFVVYTDTIPASIEYHYIKNDSIDSPLDQVLSLGGPLLLMGAKRDRFYAEIGWEVGINSKYGLSLLPSILYRIDSHRGDKMMYGVRLYSMGYSLGVIQAEGEDLQYSIGASFGPVGLEWRQSGFLVQISL